MQGTEKERVWLVFYDEGESAGAWHRLAECAQNGRKIWREFGDFHSGRGVYGGCAGVFK